MKIIIPLIATVIIATVGYTINHYGLYSELLSLMIGAILGTIMMGVLGVNKYEDYEEQLMEKESELTELSIKLGKCERIKSALEKQLRRENES